MSTSPSIRIRSGSLYLDAELYDTYFQGLDTLALLRRGDAIVLLPLQRGGTGGLLVKRKNARGDRVIHAPEFLRELGVPDAAEHELAARWDPELSGLTLPRPDLDGR